MVQRIKTGMIADGAVTTLKMANEVEELFGFRNRIINGDMRIDQRNNGASANGSTSAFTTDRWRAYYNGSGAQSFTQSTVVPDNSYKNSLLITTTITGTPAEAAIQQGIEGFNIADLAFGTADAKSLVASFWIRASVTGEYCFSLRQGSGARSFVSPINVSSSNTWQYVAVTIPGDTSGSYNSTNGNGFIYEICTGANTLVASTANTWLAGNFVCTSSQVNMSNTNGATVYLTGCQLEVGSTATPFERRPYATELALCQRYYVDLANNGGSTQNTFRCVGFASTYTTTQGSYVVQVPVPMRVLPALTQAGTMYLQNLGSTSVSSFAGPYSMAGTIIEGDFTMVGAVTANITAVLRWNSSSTQRFAYSAEF
jgi:hypothetical protein